MDWEDVKHFLAVAEAGSTLAASRRLRVSQTTTARRVGALERALGVRLFDKRSDGYVLTPDGEALLPFARMAQEGMSGFALQASAAARRVGGVVRLTALEIVAVTVLPPTLRDLAASHPDITIELDTGTLFRDISAGAADIAIRAAASPAGAGLFGRRLGPDRWSLYCSRTYAAEHGRPTSIADARRHALIGGGGEHVWAPYSAWLREHGLEAAVTSHYASSTGLMAAVRAGAGLAILPCLVADNDPELLACLPREAPGDRSIWLLTHERLRHEPRIRTVFDSLAASLKQLLRADES